MKISYLDRNWEPVGEKIVPKEYLLPDKIVVDYQHIAKILPEESFSFLDAIQISPVEDNVEAIYGVTQLYIFDIGKSLRNHFAVSLFYEKIDNDLNALASLLNVEMVEFIERDNPIQQNCAGIELDIIGVEYGMAFVHIPFQDNTSETVDALVEKARKIDHYFYTILEEIREVSKEIVPLVPSYAFDRKKIKIFISHSSKDKIFARKLRDSLNSENIETWFDEDNILVGDDFVESMEKGLVESDFIIIVLSPNFMTGPWAQKEYRTALAEQIKEGKIKILPIKYKESDVPLMLNSISHADFSKNYNNGMKILLRSIHMRQRTEETSKSDEI